MTGTHPEYASERMLDAYEAYVTGGGNLMYMGFRATASTG
jgi:N,N-dimethylformamidase